MLQRQWKGRPYGHLLESPARLGTDLGGTFPVNGLRELKVCQLPYAHLQSHTAMVMQKVGYGVHQVSDSRACSVHEGHKLVWRAGYTTFYDREVAVARLCASAQQS
jgi:hypothetical protein